MATAAFPTVVTSLIGALQAAQSLAGVRVFDGPEIDQSYPGDAIIVGDDGGEGDEMTAGSVRNTYDTIGAKRMFEDGTINCVLFSWTGGTNIADRRVRAYELLSAVDTVIRTDPAVASSCLWAGLESSTPTYRQTDAGAVVVIPFTVAYRART